MYEEDGAFLVLVAGFRIRSGIRSKVLVWFEEQVSGLVFNLFLLIN